MQQPEKTPTIYNTSTAATLAPYNLGNSCFSLEPCINHIVPTVAHATAPRLFKTTVAMVHPSLTSRKNMTPELNNHHPHKIQVPKTNVSNACASPASCCVL